MGIKSSKSKSDFAKKLSGMKKTWSSAAKEAKEMGNGDYGDELPAGNFICKLVGGKLMEVGSDNTLKMLTEFKCISGEHKGAKVTRWDNLEKEDSLKYVHLHMMALGVEDPDEIDPENLEETLNDLVESGPVVRLNVKVNDAGYTNVRVKKLLGEDEIPEDADSEGDEDEKDTGKDEEDGGDDDEKDDEDEDGDTDDAEIKKGTKVTFKVGKKTVEGIVKKVSGSRAQVETDDEIVDAKLKDLSIAEDDEGDDEKDDEDEDGDNEKENSAPEVGDRVSFEHKGKTIIGKVKKVLEKKEKVHVEAKGTMYELDFDEVNSLASEDD